MTTFGATVCQKIHDIWQKKYNLHGKRYRLWLIHWSNYCAQRHRIWETVCCIFAWISLLNYVMVWRNWSAHGWHRTCTFGRRTDMLRICFARFDCSWSRRVYLAAQLHSVRREPGRHTISVWKRRSNRSSIEIFHIVFVAVLEHPQKTTAIIIIRVSSSVGMMSAHDRSSISVCHFSCECLRRNNAQKFQ